MATNRLIVKEQIATYTELLFTAAKNEGDAEYVLSVCDQAKQMVTGANKLFKTDYAVAITGYAGPGGSPNGNVLVGTIWIAVGSKERLVTQVLSEDNGRDQNLASATVCAVRMLRDFLREDLANDSSEEA